MQGYDGRYCGEYIDATVPEMAFGEYWDTCSYTDGEPGLPFCASCLVLIAFHREVVTLSPGGVEPSAGRLQAC